MNEKEFNYMKEGVASDIITFLMEDYNKDIPQAMDILYNSETYAKLCMPSTRLYFQSSRYVYSYLQDELLQGRLS